MDIVELEITLATHTIKMDMKKKCRSFQNNNTYLKIFELIVCNEYAGVVFDCVAKQKLQDGIFIQYEETDWQFLKRVASRFEATLIADVSVWYPRISVGIPKGDFYQHESYCYTLEKQIGNYMKYKENYNYYYETEFINYEIESLQNIQLWDKLNYNKINFSISKK